MSIRLKNGLHFSNTRLKFVAGILFALCCRGWGDIRNAFKWFWRVSSLCVCVLNYNYCMRRKKIIASWKWTTVAAVSPAAAAMKCKEKISIATKKKWNEFEYTHKSHVLHQTKDEERRSPNAFEWIQKKQQNSCNKKKLCSPYSMCKSLVLLLFA